MTVASVANNLEILATKLFTLRQRVNKQGSSDRNHSQPNCQSSVWSSVNGTCSPYQVLLSLSLVRWPIWRRCVLASFNYNKFVTLLTDLCGPIHRCRLLIKALLDLPIPTTREWDYHDMMELSRTLYVGKSNSRDNVVKQHHQRPTGRRIRLSIGRSILVTFVTQTQWAS